MSYEIRPGAEDDYLEAFVFYGIRQPGVESRAGIIAVSHDSQHPGYWLDRYIARRPAARR